MTRQALFISVRTHARRAARTRLLLTIAVLASANLGAFAQGPPGGPPGPPPTPKAAAPTDVTGYWVSIVAEDWKYRMLPPVKIESAATPSFFGGGIGIPVNPAGLKAATSWDPAKDEANKAQCRSYGAANIMRVPGRVHISWQDDQTLKIETDAGMQTRLFYFGAAQGNGGDWQGVSQASWELIGGLDIPGFGRLATIGMEPSGSLKVVTTKLKPGYLRKNGVPYSASTVVTEFYDVVTEPGGDTYLLITTTVEDPVYLVEPYLTTTQFKKQADASGWSPSPCTAR